jgi:Fur family ferric uptake transcriptional regulator
MVSPHLQRQRLTDHRRAVLDAVHRLPGHPTAAEVFDAVRATRPRIAFGTVYTALHYLVEHDRVAAVRLPNGVVSYDRNTVPHDHLVCRVCGALADVPGHVSVPYYAIESRTGFRVEGHRVEFVGLCPACLARQA